MRRLVLLVLVPWMAMGLGCRHLVITEAHRDAARQWGQAYDEHICHDHGVLVPGGEVCQARNSEWMQMFDVGLSQP